MEESTSSRIVMVDINEILPNRFQPRIEFDEEEILGLSSSIKEHGIINPILVRKIGNKYEIIAGERRYKAAVLAGLDSVPVIVKDLTDKDSAEIALLENIQRKDMTSIEEAISIQKILDMGYLNQSQLAERFGKSQSYIANKIRLLKLSDEVQEALLKNKISERHARSLLKLKNIEQQNKMLKRIVTERLTVRKTDEEIDKMNNGIVNDMNSNNFITNDNNSEVTTPQANQEVIPTSLDNIFGTNVMPQTPIPEVVVPTNTNESNMQDNGDNKFFSFGTPAPVEPEIPQQNIIGTDAGISLANEVLNATPSFSEEIPVMPETPVASEVSVQPEISSTPIMEVPVMPTVDNSVESDGTEGGSQFFAQSQPDPVVETAVVPETPVASEVSVQPEIPSTPIMETAVVPETPVISEVSVQPEILSTPIMETPVVAETPVIPEVAVQPEIPSTPIMEVPAIPTMDNTVESNSTENVSQFFNQSQPDPVIETNTIEENIPQPIIITDYNKQYDPIMPPKEPPAPTIDFREIINLIRNCSDQIERSGYVIDTEEYDLEGMYQVVFKIEKK